MILPIENNGQIGLLAASAISIFIATMFVVLRLIAKPMGIRIDYSDYCIIVALLFNTALHTCNMVLVTYGGFGFHTAEVYQRFGAGTPTFFFKGIMTFALLWNTTVCFSKLSVLLMYTALVPNVSLNRWARAIGLFIILWNIGNILGGLLICRPLARNWNFAIPGTCGSQINYCFSMGVINIITDIFFVALPMPYLYRLNLETRKKALSMALLSIGVGTWVITIYRQTLLPDLDFADMTYSGVLATILSGLEPAVAIALACIPLLRPLYKSRSTGLGASQYIKDSTGLTKKGRNGRFDTLKDNSSELQLQPVKPDHHVKVSALPDGRSERCFSMVDPGGITVDKRWEVRSD